MITEDDWTEYRALVLSELKRLDLHISHCDDSIREQIELSKKELAEEISKLRDEQVLIDREVRKIKAQVVAWGSVAVILLNILSDYVS